jgi:hypothetical protein
MENDFDKILDECIDRINRDESIDSCLAHYPDLSEQLRPLLQVVFKARDAYSFVPSPSAKRAARERFNAAYEEMVRRREERQSLFGWLQGRTRVWATAAVVLIIAVIGYFGIIPALLPEEPVPYPGPTTVAPGLEPGPLPGVPSPQPEPGTVTPGLEPEPLPGVTSPEPEPVLVMLVAQPNAEGNFAFLISDDVNAISDFESVNVSISKINLHRSDDTDQLIEFEPEIGEVDLTLVQGEKTQEIWRGDVPEGEYTSVSIEVSDVRGILKETGEEVEINLPSQKLHISNHFQVSTQELTTFTYDLTVVAAGNLQSGIKYILKPQVDQSGADHKPVKEEKANKGKSNNQKLGIKDDS